MMQALVLALAAIGLIGLTGCETATPDQTLAANRSISAGVTDARIDDTHIRVTFKGDEVTSRRQVENYLLYRAADLTVGAGYDWFEMVVRNRRDATWTSASQPYGPGWGYWRPIWSYEWRPYFIPFGGPAWGAYDIDRIDQYQATAEIFVGRGQTPSGDSRAFDARQVMTILGPKIVRPS
jgi:hypothetical protein